MAECNILYSSDGDLNQNFNDLCDATKQAIDAVLEFMKLDFSAPEVSVVFTDGEEISKLNGQYRGQNKPTNVLSFPCDLEHEILGDIVIAIDVVEREAADQKKEFFDHFRHLVVHSMLHLLGYDHITDEEAQIMESLEIEILESLSISNPYEAV